MTKERLRNYLTIKDEKEQLRRLLEELEGPLYAAPAQRLTGMPSARPARGESPQERLADRTNELRELYRQKIKELEAEQLAVEEAISGLNAKQRKLLRHKYMEGLTWEEVCVAMSYSWRTVHRLHAQALERLKE